MSDNQSESFVYFDCLESHGLALVGDQAIEYLDEIDCSTVGMFPGIPEAIPAALEDYIRCQNENRSNLSSACMSSDEGSVLQEDSKISLVWGGNDIPLESGVSKIQGSSQWLASLSEFSYEDALLDQQTQITLKLKIDNKEINLYNAPYLLSSASMSTSSRTQLFSHLSVHVRLIYSAKTNTLQLDLYGDDAKTTRYQFVGWYEDNRQEAMLAHWYKRIGRLICINEPPEVRGNNV